MGLTNGFNMSAYKRFVNESQYWSPEQIEKYQMEMLTPLLQHAFDHVPYYRRLFDSLNLKPIDIRKTSDLHILPVIRKQDIMQNPHDFIPDNYKNFKHKKGHTGGTSGSPFPYYVDIKAWGMNWAVNMRTFDWAGYQYGKDRLAVMAGGSLVPTEGKGFKKRIMHYVNNYFTMQITHMDSTIMDEYYSEIKKQKIRFLRGIQCHLLFRRIFVRKTKTIAFGGCYYYCRDVISSSTGFNEKVFACDVLTLWLSRRYGNGCRMWKTQWNAFVLVEHHHIVDESGQEVKAGDTGEVVLTSLYNYSMPFIRYAPGDMAIKSDKKCDCGRSFQ